MRSTCRAFLAFASLVALPVGIAHAGDPVMPSPVQEAPPWEGEVPDALPVPILGDLPLVGILFQASPPAPAPVVEPPSPGPMPTDVPVLGAMFRGAGARPGVPGGGAPAAPPRGDAPRPPARGDAPRPPARDVARPADAARAEIAALIRKAIEDALTMRRALDAHPGRGHARARIAANPPVPPASAKPPKGPQDRPGGPAAAPRGDANVGGVIFLLGPDGRMKRYRLEGDAGGGGPDARARAHAPTPPAPRPPADGPHGGFFIQRDDGKTWPPKIDEGAWESAARIPMRPPVPPSRADGPPPPPPEDRRTASALERLRAEVRALRREVRALRRMVAEHRDDDEDGDDGDDCDECGDRGDRGDREARAGADEREGRGGHAGRGAHGRGDDARPRPRHRPRPGPLFGRDDDPNDDRR